MATDINNIIAALSFRKQYEQDSESILEQKGLERGSTDFPAMNATSYEDGERVRTNYMPVKIAGIQIYQYNVRGYLNFIAQAGREPARPFEFTAGVKEEAREAERHHIGRQVLAVAQAAFPKNFPSDNMCYYDGAQILYTAQPIKLQNDTKQAFDIDANRWTELRDIRHTIDSATVVVKKVERTISLKAVVDSLAPTAESAENLRHLLAFIEIATSCHIREVGHHAVHSGGDCFLFEPSAHGYNPRDYPEIGLGAYIAVGARTTARIVKTNDEYGAALIVEPRTAPFHKVQLVSEKVIEAYPDVLHFIDGYKGAVDNMLIGVFVRFTQRTGQIAPIDRVINETAKQKIFTRDDGTSTTVAEYFQSVYQITLKYPQLPLLMIKRRGGGEDFYPMEVCEIIDGQRLRAPKISGTIQSQLLNASTRLPDILDRDVFNNVRAFKFDGSQYLQNAGMVVGSEPLEVASHRYPPPHMVYEKDQRIQFDELRGSWRSGRYYRPATVAMWGCYGFFRAAQGGRMNALNEEEMSDFARKFVQACGRKGMQIEAAVEMGIITQTTDYAQLEERFLEAKQAGCRYIMLHTNKDDVDVHGTLKSFEQRYNIVTQNVTINTVRAAAGIGGPQKITTMENIVNKANVKCGGLNYEIGLQSSTGFLLGNTDLFLGIASSVSGFGATGGQGPTIVGYTANDLSSFIAFSGNFLFQESGRKDKVALIEKIVKETLERYHTNRNGTYPQRIFLYRDGCSEGDYPFVMKYELPLVRNAIKHSGAKLIYIVTTKLHGSRFYPTNVAARCDAKPPEQNLKIGTVIDKSVTSPYAAEYFLLSHFPRLGTARIPRYTVLANDAKIDMEELQLLTYDLCYAHQIITGPTGLPSPVYIASEFAKRGRLIYSVGCTQDSTPTSTVSITNYKNYAKKYSYDGELRDVRFNA